MKKSEIIEILYDHTDQNLMSIGEVEYEDIADALLQDEQNGAEWISVDDRLPEIKPNNSYGYSDTLFVWSDNEYAPAIYFGSYNHKLGRWVPSNDSDKQLFNKLNFTHWMPLPNPPKTEK